VRNRTSRENVAIDIDGQPKEIVVGAVIGRHLGDLEPALVGLAFEDVGGSGHAIIAWRAADGGCAAIGEGADGNRIAEEVIRGLSAGPAGQPGPGILPALVALEDIGRAVIITASISADDQQIPLISIETPK